MQCEQLGDGDEVWARYACVYQCILCVSKWWLMNEGLRTYVSIYMWARMLSLAGAQDRLRFTVRKQ